MLRDGIIDFLKAEIIGPDPYTFFKQKNGEEILVHYSPRNRYGAAVLYPVSKESVEEIKIGTEEESFLAESEIPEEGGESISEDEFKTTGQYNSSEEENNSNNDVVNLANALKQSALGITCAIPSDILAIDVVVKYARYKKEKFTCSACNGSGFEEGISKKCIKCQGKKEGYFRYPDTWTDEVNLSDVNSSSDIILKPISSKSTDEELILQVNKRQKHTDSTLYTFSVVHRSKAENFINPEDCFYQVELQLSGKSDSNTFAPVSPLQVIFDEVDTLVNNLIYRKKKNYALGHGCSVDWNDGKLKNHISSTFLPIAEVKNISSNPDRFKKINLSMRDLGKHDNLIALKELRKIETLYLGWIEGLKSEAITLDDQDYLKAAAINIKRAEYFLERYRRGIEILVSQTGEYELAQTAFKYMNRAILNQHLRFKQKTFQWDGDANLLDFAPIDVEDRKTWPEDVDYEVAWYPYQLVFIVMNLRSLVDPESDERLTTDCLWFPTGGGKTEAYLGLIAFEILHSRLSGRNSRGVVVLMRYTLRLLTAQQFQRAACMITALEHIRRGEVEKFGEEPISIGLWVGSSFTPNTLSEAIENYKNLTDAGKNEKNRLMVLKCPWCGAQMGPVKNGNYIQLKGYKRFKIIGTQKNSFKYICPNNLCDFSSREGIPLMVIDELIYENPPTMIIGTVDKFATIPWKNEALKMIAPKDGSGKPSLIIQDELHLITGPLGSMVGLYETLIKELCTTEINSTKIYPKIITSTATVNNAAHQINALYNHGIDKAEYREKYIKLFPSPGLVYSDSFFGQEIDNPKKSRVYVGVHATAYSSPITTQVRLVSALTQSIKTIGVKDAKEIDPYWTLVCYFNSLRELGRSATLLGDDIRSYLLKLQQRQNIAEQKERKRYTPFRILELTSRKVDSDISKTLEELENEYEIDNERNAYDICLATNMISVGVDVSRLGTMLVVGQPKTSSEYIQATSRVGRGTPGLVVVLYNPARPRDKSHFERFKNYHEWLYGNVEPVSVTPFSLPVVDRGLHAILVGLYQYFDPKARPHTPPSGEILAKITEIITSRISGVEDGEINEYKEKIEQIINYWDREDHTTWGKMNGYIGNQADIPLLYPFGKQIPDGLEKNVFQTPTSLRSVDAECRPEILDIEYGDL